MPPVKSPQATHMLASHVYGRMHTDKLEHDRMHVYVHARVWSVWDQLPACYCMRDHHELRPSDNEHCSVGKLRFAVDNRQAVRKFSRRCCCRSRLLSLLLPVCGFSGVSCCWAYLVLRLPQPCQACMSFQCNTSHMRIRIGCDAVLSCMHSDSVWSSCHLTLSAHSCRMCAGGSMPGVPSPTMEADSPSPRSNSIGGYIAAVVACLLVATLLAAATVFIVKRRRRKQRANSIGGHDIKNRNGGRAGTNDVPTRSTLQE